MKHLFYLNRYLYKYRYRLLLGVLFMTLSILFKIIPAQYVRYAFDIVSEGLKSKTESEIRLTILKYAGVILGTALIGGGFLYLVRQTIIVVSRFIEYDLKNEIYNHYQSLDLHFYKNNNTGDLMARISEDVSRVRMYLGPAIMYGVNLAITFILVIGYMLTINVKLTFYAILPLPILSYTIYYVNNIINKKSELIQRGISNMSSFTQETFSGINVLKTYICESHFIEKFKHMTNDYKTKSLSLVKTQALFFPFMMACIGLSIILTVYVGGKEVISGNITTGNIVEFIIYINMLTWPVTALGWITSIIQRAAASQKRINEFLAVKNMLISKKGFQKKIEGHIRFENVSFTYTDTKIKVFDKISFEIKAGETLAILGQVGSGKSTLMQLIARIYDVEEGTIYIDNKAIIDYDIQNLRKQLGYVPQDVFLFSDTIADNIRFGLANSTPEAIEKAAKQADLYNNILDLPQKFETLVGERGIMLSGGQKQRVSIARVMIKDTPILLLDDCLSAVDTQTEDNILNNLKENKNDCTTLIITHRISSAKLADRIMILEDKKIADLGTTEELLSRNIFFRELYQKQTGN